jgi:hypothetical protein
MAKRKARRQQLSLRGVFSLRWNHFNYDQTPERDLEWLYAASGNFINCSIPGPCARGLVVTTICEQAGEPVHIQLLSLKLQDPVSSRGEVAFGSLWDKLDQISSNYPNMQWWISDHRLIMDTVLPPPPIDDFYQIAGRLMREMRMKNPARVRLSQAQYLEITDQLGNFRPLEFLPKRYRKELAVWNQKQQHRGIQTFSQALKAKTPTWLRREALRILYRAHEKFKKSRSPIIGPFVV